MEEIISKKFNMLGSSLNERQRRLWAAAETLNLGYCAISIVSRATGISLVTIMRGINEFGEEPQLPPERSRRSGGGRKKLCELQPNLESSLDAIVEPGARGIPCHPCDGQHIAAAGWRSCLGSEDSTFPNHRYAVYYTKWNISFPPTEKR